MRKELIISEGYNKYYYVRLSKTNCEKENDSFNRLLEFIGKNRPHGNRNEIGSAYVAIRKETNALLNNKTNDPVLKTSKREVASIRFYYGANGKKAKKYVKIPFKIYYIFQAILNIIEEIHRDGIPIPVELEYLVKKTYLNAFYQIHFDAYEKTKGQIPIEKQAQRALENDFNGKYSPLNHVFE